MPHKLTLTLEKELIEQASLYAKALGTNLSKLVENYFKLLTETELNHAKNKVSKRVSELRGVIPASQELNYKKAIEKERLKRYDL